jgi:iron complex transport system substrate-binding protein
MLAVGAATGHTVEAAGLVEGITGDVAAIVAAVPDGDPVTYYHELDGSLFTVTSATFVGNLYSLLGMENVADPADEDGYGYPQLSAEYLLDVDPDVILLADTICCGESAATVAARPGWDRLSAVQGGRVVELDDDVASRWGPRVVEFLETVAASVYGVTVP